MPVEDRLSIQSESPWTELPPVYPRSSLLATTSFAASVSLVLGQHNSSRHHDEDVHGLIRNLSSLGGLAGKHSGSWLKDSLRAEGFVW